MPSDRSISGDAQVHPRSASAATTHPRDGTKRKLRAPPLAPLQGLPGPPAAAEALTKAGSSDGKFRMYQTDAMHAAVGSGLDGRPSAANMRVLRAAARRRDAAQCQRRVGHQWHPRPGGSCRRAPQNGRPAPVGTSIWRAPARDAARWPDSGVRAGCVSQVSLTALSARPGTGSW
jgi:hypothetical protein